MIIIFFINICNLYVTTNFDIRIYVTKIYMEKLPNNISLYDCLFVFEYNYI